MLIQFVDNDWQALAQRQADIVHQRHRRRAGATFGAVEGDEVRRALHPALEDECKQAIEPAVGADGRLEAHRLAGHLTHVPDQFQQFLVAFHFRVPVRADGIMAGRDAADPGDLLGDLAARQDAALTRFRALAQLDLDHAHLLVGGDPGQLAVIQVAVLVAHAVFCGADLEHDVGAAFQVIGRQSAFTGIHPASGHLCALRQCQHRGTGDGPVAHAGNVEERRSRVRFAAVGSDGHRARIHGILVQCRIRAIDEQDRAGNAQIAGGTERDGVVDIFRGAIAPRPLRAVEREFLAIHGKEVLAEEFAQVLEQVTEAPDDGVVAPYRVGGLRDVHDEHHHDREHPQSDGEHEHRRHHFQCFQQECPYCFRNYHLRLQREFNARACQG